MGLPEKRREEDELVEPLFAGLAGASEPEGSEPEDDPAPAAPADPWTHSRAALSRGSASPEALEPEPSLAPLVLKALLLLIVLVAVGAVVYVAFGV